MAYLGLASIRRTLHRCYSGRTGRETPAIQPPWTDLQLGARRPTLSRPTSSCPARCKRACTIGSPVWTVPVIVVHSATGERSTFGVRDWSLGLVRTGRIATSNVAIASFGKTAATSAS
jgi:hypothetical protein